MNIDLANIHRVRSKLSDGTIRYYYRIGRGKGSVAFWKVDGEPLVRATAAFAEAYHQAIREAQVGPKGRFDTLIRDYRAFVAKTDILADSTRKTYLIELDGVQNKWGSAPIRLFNDARVRGRVRNWRDSMSDNPRKADGLVGALSRVVQYAYDGGSLKANHIAGLPKLYKQKKDQEVWGDKEINLYRKGNDGVKPPSVELLWHFDVARLSGLRLGDLVTVPVTADKGNRLEWKTSKRGKTVVVPIVQELRSVLDEIKRARLERGVVATTLLFNTRGLSWTTDGLKTMTGRRRRLLGISIRMHRLRGNATLELCKAGFSDEEIAHIIGWGISTVADMRRIYIDQNEVIRAQIIRLSDKRL